MRKSTLVLLTSVLASVIAEPSLAQDWRHGGDIHAFRDHGFDHWRGGKWFHGPHGGHDGWWWIVGGEWYFYPAPIYPYPDPYVPPVVAVVPSPAAVQGTAGMQAYYYCANPPGYYPYVPACAVAWRRVLETAPRPAAVVTSLPTQTSQVAAPATKQRDLDEQQLKLFAEKLHKIDVNDVHVLDRLQELDTQVVYFRQSLSKRDYKAMGVVREAEELRRHIAEQRAWVIKHREIPTPPH